MLATPTAIELAAGIGQDRQSEAQFLFSGAVLVSSGIAGFVADRVSKRAVVISSKVAETLVMMLGAAAFWYYDRIGIAGLFAVLLLLGIQNAFVGPAKYGILPEMLPPASLPRANGVFLLLTFVAIFLGFALAGGLLNLFAGEVWRASLVCVAIAIVGTVTSFSVRRVPAARPGLALHWSSWGVSREILALLRRDCELRWAIVVVAIYWMGAAMYIQTVNALGMSQLGVGEFRTSILASVGGIGVAVGCLLGGYISRNRINRSVVTAGATGLVATLLLMSLPGASHRHLLGFAGSIPVLILMGVFSGMFIVPVQVILQSRPPRQDKGRVIAAMNQCSLVGVMLGALVYESCLWTLDATGGPSSTIFAVTAALMLPIALFYRPKDELLAKGIEH